MASFSPTGFDRPEAKLMLTALLEGRVADFNALRAKHPEITSIGTPGHYPVLENLTLEGIHLAGLNTLLGSIIKVEFVGCDLSAWNFEGGILSCHFLDCDLRRAAWPSARIANCAFTRSKLQGLFVCGAWFSDCRFWETSLASLFRTRDATWGQTWVDTEYQRDQLLRKLANTAEIRENIR